MKSIKYVLCGVALAASIGASPASAANWDPPNTAVTAQLASTSSTLTAGASVSCTSADASLTAASATQSVARTTAAHNPVNFTNCHSFIGPATVTTFGTWSFTANSTTSVTGSASNGASPVATITFHNLASCIIQITGADIPNNTWSNTTHNLTVNSSAQFEVHSSGCLGLVSSTGTLSGTFNVPAASIT